MLRKEIAPRRVADPRREGGRADEIEGEDRGEDPPSARSGRGGRGRRLRRDIDDPNEERVTVLDGSDGADGRIRVRRRHSRVGRGKQEDLSRASVLARTLRRGHDTSDRGVVTGLALADVPDERASRADGRSDGGGLAPERAHPADHLGRGLDRPALMFGRVPWRAEERDDLLVQELVDRAIARHDRGRDELVETIQALDDLTGG